jgi:3-dehydroquinate synthetase
MVMSGMMDARTVRRNTKITSATSTTASAMVWYTLLIERSMNTELSLATIDRTMPGGRSALELGHHGAHARDSSSGLAVAWRITPAVMATAVEAHALRSLAALPARAPRRACAPGKPFTFLITMSENCAGRSGRSARSR